MLYRRVIYEPDNDYYRVVTDPANYNRVPPEEDVTGKGFHEDRLAKVLKRGPRPLKPFFAPPASPDEDDDYYDYIIGGTYGGE